MSGTEYRVSEREARLAIEAMKGGGVLDLKFALINTKSIEAIENLREAGIRANPIINDPDFEAWLSGNDRKIDVLNNRYLGDKYSDAWREAIEYKNSKDLVENG